LGAALPSGCLSRHLVDKHSLVLGEKGCYAPSGPKQLSYQHENLKDVLKYAQMPHGAKENCRVV